MKSNLTINEKYINGIKQLYLKFKKNGEKLEELNINILNAKDKLSDWISESFPILDALSLNDENANDDMRIIEEKAIEYENIINSLIEKTSPIIKEAESLKLEISNIYKKIMDEYGNDFTEDEIIAHIKTKI